MADLTLIGDLRQWAVEQAVRSFGDAGCADDWKMHRRIALFLEEAGASPVSDQQSAEYPARHLREA